MLALPWLEWRELFYCYFVEARHRPPVEKKQVDPPFRLGLS